MVCIINYTKWRIWNYDHLGLFRNKKFLLKKILGLPREGVLLAFFFCCWLCLVDFGFLLGLKYMVTEYWWLGGKGEGCHNEIDAWGVNWYRLNPLHRAEFYFFSSSRLRTDLRYWCLTLTMWMFHALLSQVCALGRQMSTIPSCQ